MTAPQHDNKPWTPLEIAWARLANAAEDTANAFRALGSAYDESVRREREARHRHRTEAQQRIALLRQALRNGTVKWD